MNYLKLQFILVFFAGSIWMAKCQISSIQFELSKKALTFQESSQVNRYMQKLGDSIVVVFESGFTGEEVEVFVNSLSLGSQTLQSDESLGVAKFWPLQPLSQVNFVGIKLLNKKIEFPVQKKAKYYFVNKIGSQVTIDFSNRLHLYE